MKLKFILAAFAAATLCSFSPDGEKVEDIPTTQAFLKDPIPEADLMRIVNAGVNAPSGLNRQPWHFTVITSPETMQQLAEANKEAMKNMPFPPKGAPKDAQKGDKPQFVPGRGPKSGLGDSPVIIVISCKIGNEFDAGLACESMNDMANILGYGTKIIGSANMLFNGENKDKYYSQFGIPEGQQIIATILLGKPNCDAVTSATTRNPLEETVTFLR